MSATTLEPVGVVRSPLTSRHGAPRQPDEDAPPASIQVEAPFREAMAGLRPGDRIVVITWLHAADRGVQRVHPRGDRARPPLGVFATRSPDRPNPIGLHEVTIVAIGDGAIDVDRLEAMDGTPVLDIKPVLAPDIASR